MLSIESTKYTHGMDNFLVLIAEDEETIASILSRMVKKSFNYEVIIANSYSEALNILGKRNPDLIFIDVNLGDGNGYDLMKLLRGNPKYHSKIIMMSAYTNEPEPVESERQGADWFISKPFDKRNVLSAIREVLSL